MPSVFLSPSTRESNIYVFGHNEEYHMNLIADALESFLNAAGIGFDRNNPAFSIGTAVNLANLGSHDVYLSLHSNTAPGNLAGRLQGVDIFYFQGSAASEALAQMIAANLRNVYPHPELVNIVPNRTHYEIITPEATPILAELGFHDNPEDAQWLVEHTAEIAQALAMALTQYFGIPFVLPNTLQRGRVDTAGADIFLRAAPDPGAALVTIIPNDADLIITGETGDWYVATYRGNTGYVPKEDITLI